MEKLRKYFDNIQLKEINSVDYNFLFELLRKRDSRANISHRSMPTYKQHVKFVKSNPYSKWYVVWFSNLRIGSTYITNQDEITVHLENNFDKNVIRKFVIKTIIKYNPRKRYFINTSPYNKKLIRFLKTLGVTLLQQTYEVKPKHLRMTLKEMKRKC